MNFSNLENNYVSNLRKNRNSVYSDFYDKKAIVYCHQAHFPLEGEGLFNIISIIYEFLE